MSAMSALTVDADIKTTPTPATVSAETHGMPLFFDSADIADIADIKFRLFGAGE
jgi:hypothetical protein